jgi:ABC-type sugar transport system ATPase subunit
VGTARTENLTRSRLIEWMVGRPLDAEFPPRAGQPGPELLRVENLRRGRAVRGVSFGVRAGEILGLAGLVGAGRTETARLIFGADRPDGGTVFVDGVPQSIADPRQAIDAGICLLTEDRKAEGLVGGLSARENFGLPNLGRFRPGPFVDARREREAFAGYVTRLRIRLRDPEQTVRTLSGGNQQKVVLAKWLERDARVVLFDEPTRGIDVGAKYEIYVLMNELAAAGKAIVMISSELPEILGMSDRILVMHNGQVKGQIEDVRGATQEQILAMIVA